MTSLFGRRFLIPHGWGAAERATRVSQDMDGEYGQMGLHSPGKGDVPLMEEEPSLEPSCQHTP